MWCRTYLPRDKHVLEGATRDVDVAICEGDFLFLASFNTPNSQIRRLGSSNFLTLMFRGNCLPATVKAKLTRHPVSSYVFVHYNEKKKTAFKFSMLVRALPKQNVVVVVLTIKMSSEPEPLCYPSIRELCRALSTHYLTYSQWEV